MRYADGIDLRERGRMLNRNANSEWLEQMGLFNAVWRQQVGGREALAAVIGVSR